MLRASLNKVAVLLLLAGLFSSLLDGQGASAIRHIGRSNFEPTLDCVRRVYGKPAVWDSSVEFWTDPAIPECPASSSALQDTLAERGIRVFDAQDFVFIIASKLFQPQDPMDRPHALLKWSTIKIHLNLQTLREDDELPASARGVATEILKHARMIPFNVSKTNYGGFPTPGSVETDLNIAVWQGNLGPPNKNESVVALLNGRPNYSTARIAYGEIHDGKYVMLWDSPLFNILHGNIYFADVNGDGKKEIVIESTNYGNKEYPMLVIFDKDGREITRQKKCDTSIAADAAFSEEDGTCAIFGEEVSLTGNEEGPKDIYVTNWNDRKNHVFKLVNGLYAPGPPVNGTFPPSPEPEKAPDPAVLNEEGIKLLRAKNYGTAEIKFQQASLLSGDKNPEYANNVGFALYKEQKYELSIDWLKKAVGLDPKRAVAYLNLGDAYAALNRNAEAREAYKKYLELAPDSKTVPEVKKKLEALPASATP